MKCFYWLLLPFAILFIKAESLAQMNVGGICALRYQTDSVNTGEFFAKSGFVAQFQRAFGDMGAGSTEIGGVQRATNVRRDRAWNVRLGGYFEIYRFTPESAIVGYAFHEMNANALNDISFNPRAAQWEERIELTNLLRFDDAIVFGGGLSAGVFHRCKHDIDNSDDEINDTPSPTSLAKRVLILTGASLTYSLNPIRGKIFGRQLGINAELRGEYYASAADTRYPLNTIGRSWSDARAAFYAAIGYEYQIGPRSQVTLRMQTSSMFFRSTDLLQATIETNARVELGYRYSSKKGSTFTVYYCYESLFDEIVRVVPQAVNVHSIGIRTQPSEFW